MPELPEVETVARSLRPIVIGKILRELLPSPSYPRSLEAIDRALFARLAAGQPITAIGRRAKLITFQLPEAVVAVHLRMTGRLMTEIHPERDSRYVTARFLFDDGSALYFRDTRKFGRIYLYPTFAALDSQFGIEPLSDQFSAALLAELLGASSRQIKPFLLDQTIIAGLGNIYVDEALWSAQIHPCTPAKLIPEVHVDRLHSAIRDILGAAIERNGTTFQSFVFGDDANGEFVEQLRVFGRQGQPCQRCGGTVLKLRVVQRGTHVCTRCQRMPRRARGAAR